MKFATSFLLLLTISNTLARSLVPFNYAGYYSAVGGPQVVEVVRWRQPVCLQPAEGVFSCLFGLKNCQKEQEENGGEVNEEYSVSSESSESSSSSEEDEEQEENIRRKLVSPKVFASLPLEDLQSSEGELFLTEMSSQSNQRTLELTEEQETKIRRERHLVLAPEQLARPQEIYVTKVLDSPVTATLVVYNYVPDIGIPLCANHQNNIKPSAPSSGSKLSLTVAATGQLNQKRPTSVSEVSKESVPNEANLGSIRQPVENTRPDIAIRNRDFDEASTRLTLEGKDNTQQSNLQQVEASNNDKSTFPDIVRKPFDKSPQKQESNQFAQQDTSVVITLDAGNLHEDSKSTEEASIESDSTSKQGKVILQTVHNLVEQTGNSAINKGVANFLHGSSDVHRETKKQSNVEATVGGFVSKFIPANLFNHEHFMTDVTTEVSAETKAEGMVGVIKKLSTYVKPGVAVDVKAKLPTHLQKPDVAVDVGISTNAGPIVSVNVKPEISADTKVEDAAKIKLVNKQPETTVREKAELPANVQPEVDVESKSELGAVEKPVISADVQREDVVDVEAELSTNVQPEVSVDNKAELSTYVRPEIPQNVRPVFSADAMLEDPLSIKLALPVNEQPETTVKEEAELSANVQPEVAVETKSELAAVEKPVISADVQREDVVDVEAELSTNVQPEVPVDNKAELSATVEPGIPENVRPVFSTVVKPEISAYERLEDAEVIKEVLPTYMESEIFEIV